MKLQYSDLSFRGNRNYVKGLDLLYFFIEFFSVKEENFFIKRFTINKIITNNGYWVESKKKPSNYSALLICTIENIKRSYYFLEIKNAINKRIPNMENFIKKYDIERRLSGSFYLKEKLSSIKLYLMVEEANKILHAGEPQKLIDGKQNVKLIYYEKIKNLCSNINNFKIENVSIKIVGAYCYTVSTIRFNEEKDFPSICFGYSLESN